MPNRHKSTDDYRYGFNGKEKDDELKGKGNSLDFGARIYDSRVGRWFSTDSHESEFPEVSPYSYADNNPVFNSDFNGDYPDPKIYKIVISHVPLAPLYDRQIFKYFDTYVKLRKLKNRTPQQEEVMTSTYGNMKGAIGETLVASSFTPGLLPFFRAVAKPSYEGQHYDAVVTVNPIKAMIDRAKKGITIRGLNGGYIKLYQENIGLRLNDINGTAYTKKISFTSETKIYAEVKTIGSGRNAIKKLLKGLDQAIETAKSKKGKNEISILVTDKETYEQIIKNSKNKALIDEKLDVLQKNGGGMILKENLEQNSKAIIDNMVEKYESD